MLYTITTGTRADYASLAHHHYCGNPHNPAHILVARVNSTPIGVLVISHPALNSNTREALFGGYFNTPDKAENTRRINADLRTISRVIVHPAFRGCGIAKALVAHYLARPLTKYTEALAKMGHYCPFFERAGMTAIHPKRTRRDTMLLARIEEECIEPETLLDERAATRALKNERVYNTLKGWLNLAGATRASEPTPDALTDAAMSLIAKPIAYGYTHHGDTNQSFSSAASPSSARETGERTLPEARRRKASRASGRKHSKAAKPVKRAIEALNVTEPAKAQPDLPRITHTPHDRTLPSPESGRRRNKPVPPEPHFFKTPTTPEDLHAFIKEHTGYDIQRSSYVPGHTAPFDYLVHTFFEGLGSFRRYSHPEVPLGTPTDTPQDCVVWACRGGGKTFLGALATLLDLIFKPNIEIRIVGGSLDQSKRMFAHLKKLFQIESFSTHIAGKIGRYELTTINRSHVEILAQSETAVRGQRVQKLRCDEVALFKREVWDAAQFATRSTTIAINLGQKAGERDEIELRIGGTIEAFSTMHEPGTVMDSVVNDAHNGTRTLFKWGIADVVEGASNEDKARLLRLETDKGTQDQGDKVNQAPDAPSACPPLSPRPLPLAPSSGHIPFRDALNMMARTGLEAWQSEMLCLRPSTSNLVYNLFDEKSHVFSGTPWECSGILRTVMGMDFGFRGETVTLWAVLSADHKLYVIDELCRAERSLGWHINAINGMIGASPLPHPEWIGIDPAANQRNLHSAISSRQALNNAGFSTKDATLTIEHGIDLVRAMLAPAGDLRVAETPGQCAIPGARLLVHERCSRLIECLKTYHYDHKDRRSGIPIKDGSDHACDALRYLIINLERSGATRLSSWL